MKRGDLYNLDYTTQAMLDNLSLDAQLPRSWHHERTVREGCEAALAALDREHRTPRTFTRKRVEALRDVVARRLRGEIVYIDRLADAIAHVREAKEVSDRRSEQQKRNIRAGRSNL